MKLLYFNINYTCNSNCKFCAADFELENYGNKVMSLERIKEIFGEYEVKSGDKVILNGGEPTLNPDIVPIIKELSARDIYSVLFTNGRKLKDISFVKELLEAGVSKVTIPVYGDEKTHDNLTRVTGSFQDLIRALDNLIKLKAGYSFTLELKTLICKDNFKLLSTIWEDFFSKYLFDILLISGLIPSRVAEVNNQCLTRQENEEAVNTLLGKLWKVMPGKTSLLLDGIPICHLSNSNRMLYLGRRARINESNDAKPDKCYYFSPVDSKEGDDTEITNWDEALCPKDSCQYKHVCSLNTLQSNKEHLLEWIS